MKILLLSVFLFPAILPFAQTEVELRRQLRLNPRNLRAYTQLIELATTREQIVQVGNEALNAIGARSQIHTALGNAYLKTMDYNNAVNSYRTALSLNPRSATIYNRLGLALMRISYYRQAEVAFKAAITYSPVRSTPNLLYRTHLSVVFENLKEYDKAKQAVTSILTVDPNYQPALEVQQRLNQNS